MAAKLRRTSNSEQSFSDMFFGFPEDEDNHHHQQILFVSQNPTYNTTQLINHQSVDHNQQEEEEEEEEEEEKDLSFWDNQNQILQGTLRRTSCLETGIRKAVKGIIEEVRVSGNSVCVCGSERQTVEYSEICRNKCVMREVSTRLRIQGYNVAICKSKWRTSLDIPSGEHTFLEVVEYKKGEAVRVIIELNLRAEFKIARASEEYKRLVGRLPEAFVGKPERLQSLIKIMCSAAKKCMKEMRLHMGPWRKQRYMMAKWLGPCHRTASTGPTSLTGDSVPRPPRPKAPSMLTVDLLDYSNIKGNMHCKAVAVV